MKRRLSNEISIHAGVARITTVMSDPQRFFRCNPLVVGVDPDPAVAGAYRVDDQFEILGARFLLRYRAQIRAVDGGFEVAVSASLGTRLTNRFHLSPRGGDTLVREDVELSALGPLALLVARTVDSSHRVMLENLKRLAEDGA